MMKRMPIPSLKEFSLCRRELRSSIPVNGQTQHGEMVVLGYAHSRPCQPVGKNCSHCEQNIKWVNRGAHFRVSIGPRAGLEPKMPSDRMFAVKLYLAIGCE